MAASAMPALLLPLSEETRIVEGGDEALRISIALREALGSEGNCVVLRSRPGFASALVSTVEGVFGVRVFECGFVARLSPLRFCASGREWRALWQCIDKGVPCARPVALLGGRGVSCLVTERTANFTALNTWLERERPRLLEQPAIVRGFVSGLAVFVAALHRAGALIRDLSAAQMAVRAPRPGSERFEFQLLEIGESGLQATAPESARLANLGEFSLSLPGFPATLKLRFLREYLGSMGNAGSERAAVRSVQERARDRLFEVNTLRVAHCADPSPNQAVVVREGVTLLLNRAAPNAQLDALEEPLAATAPAQWEPLLTRHFEARIGEGGVCRIVSEIKPGDAGVARRRLEAIWGRLVELDGIAARSPRPLACVQLPGMLVALGRVNGRLESLAAHKHDRDWKLIDELAHELARLHGAGLYFLPAEAGQTMAALNVAILPGGVREFVLTGPDQLFRGTPSQLGTQAVASLGRVARALGEGMGERATKELVWAYARALFLNPFDTQMLMEEAARVPTGRTLVMTRGIEKSRLARGVKG